MTASRPSARRRFVGGAALVALAAGLLFAPAPDGADEAQARPQHNKYFGMMYEADLGKETLKKGRCDICHEKTQPKDKKIRNPYGAALAKLLKENEKDPDVINEVFKKVAEEDSCVEDKTYGDLIKDGKLPNEGCEPVKPSEESGELVPIPDPTN